MVLASELDNTIGGPEIEVQIDECKLGKRKYNRGHWVQGVWVFGGVEKSKQRKCFMVIFPDRIPETLFAFIKQFILPGSVIRRTSLAPTLL
jgi:hypothetical protein